MPQDRPTMKLPALRRRQEIDRQINALYTEKQALDESANNENGINGLMKMGERGATFRLVKLNNQCITGIIVDADGDGYELQKEFGVEGYHSGLNFDVDNFRFSFTANDGELELFISFPNVETKPGQIETSYQALLPENLEKVKILFKRFGFKADAVIAQRKKRNLLKEAAALDEFIKAIEDLNT